VRVVFTETADADLRDADANLRKFFIKHVEKISRQLPARHLRFGVPYFVEEVTRQTRLVYEVKNDTIFVVRCFANHKDYEKWFKSFK